uniref:Uncharacterized protein n=1 Tax=Anguilla anguilla TaxID=7936 RepID=A0A0E9U033_ANGAN
MPLQGVGKATGAFVELPTGRVREQPMNGDLFRLSQILTNQPTIRGKI